MPEPNALVDYITPIKELPLNTSGHAAHWAINLAEAATTKTGPNWDVLTDTQEQWDATFAQSANAAWQPYLPDDVRPKSGLTMDQVRAKHGINFSLAYDKAKASRARMFANDAALYTERTINGTDPFAYGTLKSLSLTGALLLSLRGPIARHIMLLCGNTDVLLTNDNGAVIHAIAFPEPPFVEKVLRVAFNSALIGVLNQQGLFTLRWHDIPLANPRLDIILTAFLDSAYAPPPLSYIHFERTATGTQLHTYITRA